MEKEFDFDKIGKRMPYNTPDGFFEEMEANVWNKVKAKRRGRCRRIVVGALSVAASIAFVIVMWTNHAQSQRMTSDDFEIVEQAFCNLSQEDQAYMLQVYQEDVFLNEDDGEI